MNTAADFSAAVLFVRIFVILRAPSLEDYHLVPSVAKNVILFAIYRLQYFN